MNTEVFDLRSDTNITTAAKKTMFYARAKNEIIRAEGTVFGNYSNGC